MGLLKNQSCWVGLSGGNGCDGGKHRRVDGPCVVKERSHDGLDIRFSCGIEGSRIVGGGELDM